MSAAGVRVPLARARVAEIARAVLARERVRDAELSFTFVGDDAAVARNRRHLGHRGPRALLPVELGTLHAAGHTHPEDDGREASPMWRRQERYLARLLEPAQVAAAR